MTLWPQTLLARSVLLIAMLLVLAHLAWLQIFRVSTREPRARQVSQQIISTINLTRAALVTAEPSKRFSLLSELAAREGVQVHVAKPGETLAPLPKTGFYEFVEADLRAQLGAATRFTLARDGIEELVHGCFRAAPRGPHDLPGGVIPHDRQIPLSFRYAQFAPTPHLYGRNIFRPSVRQ